LVYQGAHVSKWTLHGSATLFTGVSETVNRTDSFARGLSASWFAAFITVIYGLVSVPLALHYLSVEKFGLLMLLLQLAGYFTLIEIGMSGATARLLIDYKDTSSTDSYGSLILTASLVFAIQAVIILLVGLFGAPRIVMLLGTPLHLQEDATFLLRWLCGCFAFVTTFKIFGSVLYANKRLDLINIFSSVGVLVGLALMALVLASGGNLQGLFVVFVVQALLTVIFQGLGCWWFKLLPQHGRWGRPTAAHFKETFLYAKDVFFFNVSNQILEASQLIIVSKTMGLTAAAMWSVGTKVFNLLQQVLTKIEGTAVVFFSEMMVRGEHALLKKRFQQIYEISAGAAVASLAVAVAVNKPFVTAWAEPSLAWPISLSALMAIAIFFNVVSRCHIDFILNSKKLLALRYIYLIEAVAFVSTAFVLTAVFGLYGVILAAISCMIFVRMGYTCWRISKYFHIPKRLVYWDWLKRPVLSSLVVLPFVISSPWITAGFASPLAQTAVAATWTGVPALSVLSCLALHEETSMVLRRQVVGVAMRLAHRLRSAFQ
jgi:O-antigen/teichoic acid export membrane protein